MILLKKAKKVRAKVKIKRELLTEKTSVSRAIKMHPKLKEFFIKKAVCFCC